MHDAAGTTERTDKKKTDWSVDYMTEVCKLDLISLVLFDKQLERMWAVWYNCANKTRGKASKIK